MNGTALLDRAILQRGALGRRESKINKALAQVEWLDSWCMEVGVQSDNQHKDIHTAQIDPRWMEWDFSPGPLVNSIMSGSRRGYCFFSFSLTWLVPSLQVQSCSFCRNNSLSTPSNRPEASQKTPVAHRCWQGRQQQSITTRICWHCSWQVSRVSEFAVCSRSVDVSWYGRNQWEPCLGLQKHRGRQFAGFQLLTLSASQVFFLLLMLQPRPPGHPPCRPKPANWYIGRKMPCM